MECPVFCDTENSNLVRYNHTLKLQNMIPRAVCDGYFMIFPCRHRPRTSPALPEPLQMLSALCDVS